MALLGTIALAGLPAAPAGAAGATGIRGANHCVLDLDTGRLGCAADDRTARGIAGVAPAALIIARLYDHGEYTGIYLTLRRSRPCTATTSDDEGRWHDLRRTGIGWDNRISSVHTYNRCDVKLYDGYNLTGAQTHWINHARNLAHWGWNDRASSLRVS